MGVFKYWTRRPGHSAARLVMRSQTGLITSWRFKPCFR